MDRTRVRRRRLLAGTVLAGGVLLGAQAANALGEVEGGPDAIHVVRPGDTLWSIARQVAPGHDPRPLIQAIEEANGLSATDLVPGQSLRVPLDA